MGIKIFQTEQRQQEGSTVGDAWAQTTTLTINLYHSKPTNRGANNIIWNIFTILISRNRINKCIALLCLLKRRLKSQKKIDSKFTWKNWMSNRKKIQLLKNSRRYQNHRKLLICKKMMNKQIKIIKIVYSKKIIKYKNSTKNRISRVIMNERNINQSKQLVHYLL